MIGRPLIFSYHPYILTYLRGERWMKVKRDKVFVGSRPHVTCLCGGLSVYATYGCACITTLIKISISSEKTNILYKGLEMTQT